LRFNGIKEELRQLEHDRKLNAPELKKVCLAYTIQEKKTDTSVVVDRHKHNPRLSKNVLVTLPLWYMKQRTMCLIRSARE